MSLSFSFTSNGRTGMELGSFVAPVLFSKICAKYVDMRVREYFKKFFFVQEIVSSRNRNPIAFKRIFS